CASEHVASMMRLCPLHVLSLPQACQKKSRLLAVFLPARRIGPAANIPFCPLSPRSHKVRSAVSFSFAFKEAASQKKLRTKIFVRRIKIATTNFRFIGTYRRDGGAKKKGPCGALVLGGGFINRRSTKGMKTAAAHVFTETALLHHHK